MSKAYAFIQNKNSQTITGGGVVNLDSAVHGFGCTCCKKIIEVNGNNVNLNAGGYYDVVIGATISATAAGNVTLALYQDGNLLAQTATAIAAANDPASVVIPVGVLVNNCSSTLAVVASSTAGDPIVGAIQTTIEKV